MPRRAGIVIVVLALAAAAGCGEDGGQAADRFDADRALRDLRAQVAIGPRATASAGSRRVVRLIAERLRRAGAQRVGVQRPYRNVVATLPGDEPGWIVVGAHHDTKDGIPSFVGANDGASGVAVVLELARSLPRPLPGPSVQLVLFDGEEARGDLPFETDGTRGSSQFVAYAGMQRQGAARLAEIRAMVLFDLVGDCELGLPREGLSDEGLYAKFEDAAEEVGGAADDAFGGTTDGVGDDHVPFLEAGVPAVDLIDFVYGPGERPGDYWHTAEDTLDKVCAESLDAVGETAVRAIPEIGR